MGTHRWVSQKPTTEHRKLKETITIQLLLSSACRRRLQQPSANAVCFRVYFELFIINNNDDSQTEPSSGLAFLLGSIIMANLWLWSLLLCAFSSGTAAFCLNFYGVAQAFPFARFSFQQKDIRNKGIYPKWGKNLFKKKKRKRRKVNPSLSLRDKNHSNGNTIRSCRNEKRSRETEQVERQRPHKMQPSKTTKLKSSNGKRRQANC